MNLTRRMLLASGAAALAAPKFAFAQAGPIKVGVLHSLSGTMAISETEHHIPAIIYGLFPVLQNMTARRGGDLSGGQQQQLAIARALIMRPKVLLLDEPTEGIQLNIIRQIGRAINYLKAKSDMAIVLVEQCFDFAFDLADCIYILRRGAVVFAGRKSDSDRITLRREVSV